MKVILIGALPPPVGGTTVLFENLVSELISVPDVEIVVIDVARRTKLPLANALAALGCMLRLVPLLRKKVIVSYHGSIPGALYLGALIRVVTRLFRVKYLFRGFGGDFDVTYGNLSGWRRSLFRYGILGADRLLLERKRSVAYFAEQGKAEVDWYPNSRPARAIPGKLARTSFGSEGCRFVFVGHVKESKGLGVLASAARLLRQARVPFSIDVYGSLEATDAEYQDWFGDGVLSYRGVISPSEVIATIESRDALVLPTYWRGEGYPGVIIEAYLAGRPVVATRWGGIPEIVSARCGILVEPEDAQSLFEAMKTIALDGPTRLLLAEGAVHEAQQFESARWTGEFVRICKNLTEDTGKICAA